MKLQFKKELPLPPLPNIILRDVRVHVTSEMKIGLQEQTGLPVYILKLEMPTDMNGVQAVLGSLASDGSILVDVKDGTAQDQDQH